MSFKKTCASKREGKNKKKGMMKVGRWQKRIKNIVPVLYMSKITILKPMLKR
jgi:hypothetical protein